MELKPILEWEVSVSSSSQRKVGIYAEVDYNGNSNKVYIGANERIPTLYEVSSALVIKDNVMWDPIEDALVPVEYVKKGTSMAVIGILSSSDFIEAEFPKYYKTVKQDLKMDELLARQYYYFVMLFPYLQICRKYKNIANGITTKSAEGKNQKIYYHSIVGEMSWIPAAMHWTMLVSVASIVAAFMAISQNVLYTLIYLIIGGGIGFLRFNSVRNRELNKKALWSVIEDELEKNYKIYKAKVDARYDSN